MKLKVVLKKEQSKKSGKPYLAVAVRTPLNDIVISFKVDEISYLTGVSVEDLYNMPVGVCNEVGSMEVNKK